MSEEEPKKKRRGKRRNYAEELRSLETRAGMAVVMLRKAQASESNPDVRESMMDVALELLTGRQLMQPGTSDPRD